MGSLRPWVQLGAEQLLIGKGMGHRQDEDPPSRNYSQTRLVLRASLGQMNQGISLHSVQSSCAQSIPKKRKMGGGIPLLILTWIDRCTKISEKKILLLEFTFDCFAEMCW